MSPYYVPNNNRRVGFYYYPDSLHYQIKDLHRWLPELKALGTQWLVLNTPGDIAIPEHFITGLVKEGIEPILHFNISLESPPSAAELQPLLQAYHNWGVHYIVLFDRPNSHKQWNSTAWTQNDLVGRFLDIFLPLVESVIDTGMIPVFPPLEPGGAYWDTAFLRAALQEIEDRGLSHLFDKLVLGAYAWAHNLPLNWGAGGPERWPGARPYFTPEGEQDQRGFYIFDWYTAIAQAVTGGSLPILLLACGSRPGDDLDSDLAPVDDFEHGQRNLQIARLLADEQESMMDGVDLDTIPENVLAGCFWLLSTDEGSEYAQQSWYQPDGNILPAVQFFQGWVADSDFHIHTVEKTGAPVEQEIQKNIAPPLEKTTLPELSEERPINHYLLLPQFSSGINDWYLDAIRPYVKKHAPTVGFSIEEARRAKKVTIIGEPNAFPPDTIGSLSSQGCSVLYIGGDGTSIATQLKTI